MDEQRNHILNALLSSDLATEVKATFEGRLSVGFDVPAATGFVFARFREALSSENDGPVVLLAIAALQVRDGFLMAVVRDAATDLIASGEALAAYRADDWQVRKSREEILEGFAEILEAMEISELPEEAMATMRPPSVSVCTPSRVSRTLPPCRILV